VTALAGRARVLPLLATLLVTVLVTGLLAGCSTGSDAVATGATSSSSRRRPDIIR